MAIDTLSAYMASSGLYPKNAQGGRNQSDPAIQNADAADQSSIGNSLSKNQQNAPIAPIEKIDQTGFENKYRDANASGFDAEAYLMDPSRKIEEAQTKLAAKMFSEIKDDDNSISGILNNNMKASLGVSMVEAAYSEF